MTPAELKQWRTENGYGSQGALAKELDMHYMSISRWERGEIPIPAWCALALEALARRRLDSAGRTPRKVKTYAVD